MSEQGQVISVSGNEVIVRLERTEACAKCRACIAGMSKKEMLIKAKNICDANIDDWVNIELQNDSFVKAVLIMYAVPFVFLIVGFLFGYFICSILGLNNIQEILGFLMGIVFMVLSYFVIRSREKSFQTQKYTPVAVSIVSER